MVIEIKDLLWSFISKLQFSVRLCHLLVSLLDTEADTKAGASDASYEPDVSLEPANSGILGRCDSPLTPETQVRFSLGLPGNGKGLALIRA